jgi:hypothetical protein
VIETVRAADRRVMLHEYPKLGTGGVLIETFRRCDADLVGFVDADGATRVRPADTGGLAAVSRMVPG